MLTFQFERFQAAFCTKSLEKGMDSSNLDSDHFPLDAFCTDSMKIEAAADVSATIEFIDAASTNASSNSDKMDHFICDDGNFPVDSRNRDVGEISTLLVVNLDF